MTRLIDADDVIKYCCQFYRQCCHECEKCGFAKSVKNIPTAYDVDKVVKELEEEQEQWLRGYNQTLEMGIEHLWRNFSGRVYGVASAIDIVKRGGIDE